MTLADIGMAPFKLSTIQKHAYDALQALNEMHKVGVIHADLKRVSKNKVSSRLNGW